MIFYLFMVHLIGTLYRDKLRAAIHCESKVLLADVNLRHLYIEGLFF